MKRITILPSGAKPKDGTEYFFMRSEEKGMIKQGTCCRCEMCAKVCVTNEVGVLAFEEDVNMIWVNNAMMDAPEIAGYDERDHLVKCDDCHNKEIKP